MAQSKWTESASAWEQALLSDVKKQESLNTLLSVCNYWQQYSINQISQQFVASSLFLSQNQQLSKTIPTWALYQYLMSELLSSLNVSVKSALLLEVQILSSRLRSYGIPYPETLEEAYHSLDCAVDKCVQETLRLEDVERHMKAEHAMLANENSRLEARLRALQMSAGSSPNAGSSTDSSTDSGGELMCVRRLSVANVSARANSIHIDK